MAYDRVKLFVGGISRETSVDNLREHFSKYGTVLPLLIARDRHTANPGGFAFVLFSNSDSAEEALKDSHIIRGRTVEVKKAKPRTEQDPNQQQLESIKNNSNDQFSSTKKIYVGGLPGSLTDEEFKNYFQRFGRITDARLIYDRKTHQPKGFGFVTFDLKESVENVLHKEFYYLKGKRVKVARFMGKEGINGRNSEITTRATNVGSTSSYPGNNGITTSTTNVARPYSNNVHETRSWYSYQHFPWHGHQPLSWYGYHQPPPGYGYGSIHAYGGQYPVGGYGQVYYSIAPIAAERSWNGSRTIGYYYASQQ